MEETLFSKIISKEIPAEVIYEDDEVLAFLDINPVNPGGTLVIPKTPSRNLTDISSESWGKVMEVVRVLAPKIKEAVGADGFNIIMNNESVGGQIIFHTHVHIVPRHKGDGVEEWPGHPYLEGEKEKLAEKIRAAL